MNVDKGSNLKPARSAVCPVTGLRILSKPEWTDVGFGKDYKVTIKIIGESILWVQASGYVTLPNQINALRLTDQVPSESISGGRPYIHIEDLSNFKGGSLASRKCYMDEMPKRKRISGVIFCHASSMLKMSINLGKRFRIVEFPVHLVDDYSEAVRLALEIQSKEKALEKPSAVVPGYENILPEEFPLDDQSSCPVTYLPVVMKPEWKDIRIDDDFSVTFTIIGKAILFTVLKGTLGMAGMENLVSARERVLMEAGLMGKKYVEIVDYRLYSGYPSKETRMMLANFLLKEVDSGSLIGFWVFNTSTFIRWMYNVSTRLYKRPVFVSAVRDYEEAVKNAVQVLEKSGVDVGAKQYKRFTRNDWGFEFETFAVHFELIGDDIIYGNARGTLRECHIEKLRVVHEKVLEETGLMEKGYFYRIVNWENLQKTTWKARKMYLDNVKEISKRIPCRFSVLFGANKFMKTIIGFSKQFVPVPVALAHSFEEALMIVEREKKRGPGTKLGRKTRKHEKTFTQEGSTRNILMNCCNLWAP